MVYRGQRQTKNGSNRGLKNIFMDKLETYFKNELLEHIRVPQFNIFKSSNPSIYEAILEVLRKVNLNHIDNDILTLVKPDVKNLTLQIGKPKTFIFCGIFYIKGIEVILLELSEKLGTYYLKDASLVRQLKRYKIGTKIRFEKVKVDGNKDGVSMTLPMEQSSESDLFSSDESITDGKRL